MRSTRACWIRRRTLRSITDELYILEPLWVAWLEVKMVPWNWRDDINIVSSIWVIPVNLGWLNFSGILKPPLLNALMSWVNEHRVSTRQPPDITHHKDQVILLNIVNVICFIVLIYKIDYYHFFRLSNRIEMFGKHLAAVSSACRVWC